MIRIPILLVACDFKGQRLYGYRSFLEALAAGPHIELSDGLFAVETDESVEALCSRLSPHVDPHDRLLVFELRAWNGAITEEASSWLNERRPGGPPRSSQSGRDPGA